MKKIYYIIIDKSSKRDYCYYEASVDGIKDSNVHGYSFDSIYNQVKEIISKDLRDHKISSIHMDTQIYKQGVPDLPKGTKYVIPVVVNYDTKYVRISLTISEDKLEFINTYTKQMKISRSNFMIDATVNKIMHKLNNYS